YTKLTDHPVLRTDPKYAALKGEGVEYHTYGWPAPPSDKVQLITNAYILPNMIAKAVTGTSTKDSIAWAENEMKKVMAGKSRPPGSRWPSSWCSASRWPCCSTSSSGSSG